MLADDLSDLHRRLHGPTSVLVVALEQAARFALSPGVVAAATQLADPDKVEAARAAVFLPHGITWIEWSGTAPGTAPATQRHGLLLHPAHASYVLDVHAADARGEPEGERLPLSLSAHFDPAGPGPLLRLDPVRDHNLAPIVQAVDARRLGAFVGGVLALINTPRVVAAERSQLEKLNAARVKRGRARKLDYSTVILVIDRDTRQAAGLERAGPGERGGVAGHAVRAHLRIRLGRVEIVRSHTRGDLTRPAAPQRFAVRTAAEAKREQPV